MVYEDMDRQKRWAGVALDISAVRLQPKDPFTWASGYRMPIYNDNRLFLQDPELRMRIAREFMVMMQHSLQLEFDVIAGTATAGIPHATTLADCLKLPLVYIRDKPKDHGMRNQIEGISADSDLGGKRVLVLEDIISTGGSSASAVRAVRDANGLADYLFCIFNYDFDNAALLFAGQRPFVEGTGMTLAPPCNVRSLFTYNALVDVAKERRLFSNEEGCLLEDWRRDPFGWGEKHGFPRVKR